MKTSISLRIEEELKNKLDRAAKSREIDISELIRGIIENALTKESSLGFIKESLQAINLQADKLDIEAKNIISKKISDCEIKIDVLNKHLEDVIKIKDNAKKIIQKVEDSIKEYYGFEKFLDELNKLDNEGLYDYYQKIIESMPIAGKTASGITKPQFKFLELQNYYRSKILKEELR